MFARKVPERVRHSAGDRGLARKARHARVRECFAENKIDLSVLPHLTDQDLKDIGVPLGHRRNAPKFAREIQAHIARQKRTAPLAELRTQVPPAMRPEPSAHDRATAREATARWQQARAALRSDPSAELPPVQGD
jgi:hypothetical protein